MYRRILTAILLVIVAIMATLMAACDSGGVTLVASPTAPPPTSVAIAPTATLPQVAVSPTLQLTATTQAVASPTARPMAVAPAWARDAVLYQIFVRNYTPEGTLAVAEKTLPGLQEMGVNLIYLMPIHPIGELKRKGTLGSPYSIRDYMAIDPALGTEADLKSFVDKAHSLKMRVIMDLVANHTSWDNVLTTQHPDWYKHAADGSFLSPNPDWTDVIQLDHSKPKLLEYMADMTSHYVRDDGVDGFRCDYSVGVPIAFWLGLRDALKKVNPDVFLLSENDDQPLTAAFDATYDQDTYKEVLTAYLSHNPRPLLAIPLSDRSKYGDQRLRTRFFENHDHNRVAYPFQTSPQALRAVTTYLLTTDDIPFIENGQELAITETTSLFEMDKIKWAAGDPTLRDLFKKELAVRNANPALRHGDIARADAGDPTVLAFLRRSAATADSPEQQVLVVISFAAEQKHATVTADIAKKTGKDLESGAELNLAGGLDLPPWSWRIIELK